MLDRIGKVAIPMLFFAGIPFLFAGPVIGVICWVIAAALIVVLYTPVRDWLGIPRPQKTSSPIRERVGYRGRTGSYGNLSQAKFGKDLDTAIDNEGDVDASKADFE
jgi:hypothetical protein